MTNRVSSGGLLLPPSAVRSESPCRAEVMRSLAGRAAELYELALGESCQSGSQPITRPNPQGLTGWDLSGPPWGSALLHPVAWFAGRQPNTAQVIAPDIADQTERLFGGVAGPALIRWPIYIRAFDALPAPSIAPYGRLTLAIRTHRVSGASLPTATVRIWNPAAGQGRPQARSVTFTTATNETSFVFSNAEGVDAVPGRNEINLEVAVESNDTSQHYIDSAILYVAVKRSH